MSHSKVHIYAISWNLYSDPEKKSETNLRELSRRYTYVHLCRYNLWNSTVSWYSLVRQDLTSRPSVNLSAVRLADLSATSLKCMNKPRYLIVHFQNTYAKVPLALSRVTTQVLASALSLPNSPFEVSLSTVMYLGEPDALLM